VVMMKDTATDKAFVFVVDDDEALRESLGSLFRSVGLEVKTFASTQAFLRTKLPDAPSCLVLDVRLPGMSGLDFQGELAKSDIHLPIVFMTGHGDIPMTVKAMKAGAVEFLIKPFREQDLLDAVRIGIERSNEDHRRDRDLSKIRACYEALTPREQEVFGHVTRGLMNKQIAGEMNVSEITVKVHRGNVMRKMSARSLAELVRMADSLGVPQKRQ
jgi:FixJ family two-component response regulator